MIELSIHFKECPYIPKNQNMHSLRPNVLRLNMVPPTYKQSKQYPSGFRTLPMPADLSHDSELQHIKINKNQRVLQAPGNGWCLGVLSTEGIVVHDPNVVCSDLPWSWLKVIGCICTALFEWLNNEITIFCYLVIHLLEFFAIFIIFY